MERASAAPTSSGNAERDDDDEEEEEEGEEEDVTTSFSGQMCRCADGPASAVISTRHCRRRRRHRVDHNEDYSFDDDDDEGGEEDDVEPPSPHLPPPLLSSAAIAATTTTTTTETSEGPTDSSSVSTTIVDRRPYDAVICHPAPPPPLPLPAYWTASDQMLGRIDAQGYIVSAAAAAAMTPHHRRHHVQNGNAIIASGDVVVAGATAMAPVAASTTSTTTTTSDDLRMAAAMIDQAKRLTHSRSASRVLNDHQQLQQQPHQPAFDLCPSASASASSSSSTASSLCSLERQHNGKADDDDVSNSFDTSFTQSTPSELTDGRHRQRQQQMRQQLTAPATAVASGEDAGVTSDAIANGNTTADPSSTDQPSDCLTSAPDVVAAKTHKSSLATAIESSVSNGGGDNSNRPYFAAYDVDVAFGGPPTMMTMMAKRQRRIRNASGVGIEPDDDDPDDEALLSHIQDRLHELSRSVESCRSDMCDVRHDIVSLKNDMDSVQMVRQQMATIQTSVGQLRDDQRELATRQPLHGGAIGGGGGGKGSATARRGRMSRNGMTVTLAYCIVASVLGMFQFGFNTAVINAPESVVEKFIRSAHRRHYDGRNMSYKSSTFLYAIAVSIFAVGGVIGGFSGHWLANNVGRRGALMTNTVIGIAGSVCMGMSKFVHSYHLLIIGRFVIGINSGVNTAIVPMYMSEITPLALRPMLGMFSQLAVTTGLVVAQILGVGPGLLGTDRLWPVLIALPLAPLAVQTLMLPFCVESPRYLLIQRRLADDAAKALRRLRQQDDITADLAEMDAEDVRAKVEPRLSLRQLLFQSPHLRRPLLIAVVMQLSQQLSGINAVFYYSTNLFITTGLSDWHAKLATIGIGGVMFIMTFATLPLVTGAWVGRRTLHLYGLGGMFIFSIFITISFLVKEIVSWVWWLSVVATLIYVIFFALGPGCVPWMITAELFAPAARPAAIAVALLVNWTANFLVGIGFPTMQTALENYTFLPFSMFLAFFWVFTYWQVPETKKKKKNLATVGGSHGQNVAKFNAYSTLTEETMPSLPPQSLQTQPSAPQPGPDVGPYHFSGGLPTAVDASNGQQQQQQQQQLVCPESATTATTATTSATSTTASGVLPLQQQVMLDPAGPGLGQPPLPPPPAIAPNAPMVVLKHFTERPCRNLSSVTKLHYCDVVHQLLTGDDQCYRHGRTMYYQQQCDGVSAATLPHHYSGSSGAASYVARLTTPTTLMMPSSLPPGTMAGQKTRHHRHTCQTLSARRSGVGDTAVVADDFHRAPTALGVTTTYGATHNNNDAHPYQHHHRYHHHHHNHPLLPHHHHLPGHHAQHQQQQQQQQRHRVTGATVTATPYQSHSASYYGHDSSSATAAMLGGSSVCIASSDDVNTASDQQQQQHHQQMIGLGVINGTSLPSTPRSDKTLSSPFSDFNLYQHGQTHQPHPYHHHQQHQQQQQQQQRLRHPHHVHHAQQQQQQHNHVVASATVLRVPNAAVTTASTSADIVGSEAVSFLSHRRRSSSQKRSADVAVGPATATAAAATATMANGDAVATTQVTRT